MLDLGLTLIPLILYVVIDMKYGLKAGLIAAVAAMIFLGIWYYLRVGQIDALFAVDAGLVIGMGLLSLRLQNSNYFKYQPAVMGGILSLYFAYCQFSGEPMFVRYLPTMSKLNPQVEVLAANPLFIVFLSNLSRDCIFLFLFHTALMIVAARYWTTLTWMWCRLAIYPLMILLTIFAGQLYLNM